MHAPVHTLENLFEQMGLPNQPNDVDSFIEKHGPLASEVKLEEAAFWTDHQAAFLREQLIADADWAEVVDELNTRLRHYH